MDAPTREELEAARCWWPSTDQVPDPAVTTFKQQARLHQAQWRAARSYPIGHQPMSPSSTRPQRPCGSRIELSYALEKRVNLLDARARAAAVERLEHPQVHQTLDANRLWADLLSSMPLCFNLFGPLAVDLDLARQVVGGWFPDLSGDFCAVRLEWSPGRRDPAFLGNRTAFDVAIELDLGDGSLGVIGIETKYHEHAVRMPKPKAAQQARHAQARHRYREVAERSKVFLPGSVDLIVDTPVEQLWLDHLLALSMVQHPSKRWSWARSVLIHPAGNPSFAEAGANYRSHLADSTSFEVRTLEELLGSTGPLPAELREPLRERYLW